MPGLRWLRTLLGLAMLAMGPAALSQAASTDSNPFDRVGRAYLVEINGASVWHKNARQRLAPASLTKLMTALLVAQQLPPDTPVTVGAAAAAESGSRLGLRRGEVLRAKDLLAAMLLASANDACRALADHVGGDQPHFVHTMNQTAQRMGLRDTHFANACGHDAPAHFSSAADLRTLAYALMQSPPLAALVAQAALPVATVDGSRSFALKNSNALLGRYPGVVGLKTGTTTLAGQCLVALARRKGNSVLLVLLGGRDRWWDAADVLDIAFARAEAEAYGHATP